MAARPAWIAGWTAQHVRHAAAVLKQGGNPAAAGATAPNRPAARLLVLAQRLGVTEDDIGEGRRADLVFSACSLDAASGGSRRRDRRGCAGLHVCVACRSAVLAVLSGVRTGGCRWTGR